MSLLDPMVEMEGLDNAIVLEIRRVFRRDRWLFGAIVVVSIAISALDVWGMLSSHRAAARMNILLLGLAGIVWRHTSSGAAAVLRRHGMEPGRFMPGFRPGFIPWPPWRWRS